MNRVGILLSLALVCMVVACNNQQAAADQDMGKKQDEDTSVSAAPIESVEATPRGKAPAAGAGKGAPSVGAGMQRLVDLAAKDLAGTIGIEQSDIQVVEADYVTWRDSGLGCPQPGYQYMQVLTNGSRIVLSANGQMYHYHSGGNRAPFHCKNPSKVDPLPYAHGEA